MRRMVMHKTRITYLIFGIFFCFLLLMFFDAKRSEKAQLDLKLTKQCYRRTLPKNIGNNDEYSITYLADIMDADKRPASGKSIFFHETSCSKTGLVDLNVRQSCAIESAAKLNPNRDIFVLFSSPVGFRESFSSLPTNIQILKTYSNVHLLNNDVWKYAEGTPLEKWLTTDTLFESKYLFEHMSDVLRYLTFYKFGGIYMDLDVVVQRNFDELGENYAADDSEDAIGCSILHIGNDAVGRKVSERCLRFIERNFNGKMFINNGPLVITRTLEELCQTTNRKLMTRERCQGFRLLPESTFYSIAWADWKWFFDAELTNRTLKLVENSTAVHLWNDVSKNEGVKIGSHTAYEVLAKENCPKIYYSRSNYEYF